MKSLILIFFLCCVSISFCVSVPPPTYYDPTFPSLGSPSFNLETLSYLLSLTHSQDQRESLALEFITYLFMNGSTLSQHFSQPSFAKTLMYKEATTTLSKHKILSSYLKELQEALESKQRDVNLYFQGAAAARCVSCITLQNLLTIMCDQHYTLRPGTCVECSFLRQFLTLLCSLNCTTVNVTMFGEVSPPGSSTPVKTFTQQVPCVFCDSYFVSISMFCGPPVCENYYGYLDEQLKLQDNTTINSKRSLINDGDFTAPMNCIPCYFQYVAYELVCTNLFTKCVPPGTTITTRNVVSTTKTVDIPEVSFSDSSSPNSRKLKAVLQIKDSQDNNEEYFESKTINSSPYSIQSMSEIYSLSEQEQLLYIYQWLNSPSRVDSDAWDPCPTDTYHNPGSSGIYLSNWFTCCSIPDHDTNVTLVNYDPCDFLDRQCTLRENMTQFVTDPFNAIYPGPNCPTGTIFQMDFFGNTGCCLPGFSLNTYYGSYDDILVCSKIDQSQCARTIRIPALLLTPDRINATCPPQYVYHQNNTCCPASYNLNRTTNQCYVPSFTFVRIPSSPTINSFCPSGYLYNSTWQVCCKPGYFYNTSSNLCCFQSCDINNALPAPPVYQGGCTTGFYLNITYYVCCPVGSVLEPGSGLCFNSNTNQATIPKEPIPLVASASRTITPTITPSMSPSTSPHGPCPFNFYYVGNNLCCENGFVFTNNLCCNPGVECIPPTPVFSPSSTFTPSASITSSRSLSLTPSRTRSPSLSRTVTPTMTPLVVCETTGYHVVDMYQCCPSNTTLYDACIFLCHNGYSVAQIPSQISFGLTLTSCPPNSVPTQNQFLCCPTPVADPTATITFDPVSEFCFYNSSFYDHCVQGFAQPIFISRGVSRSNTPSVSSSISRTKSASLSKSPSVSTAPHGPCPSGTHYVGNNLCCLDGFYYNATSNCCLTYPDVGCVQPNRTVSPSTTPTLSPSLSPSPAPGSVYCQNGGFLSVDYQCCPNSQYTEFTPCSSKCCIPNQMCTTSQDSFTNVGSCPIGSIKVAGLPICCPNLGINFTFISFDAGHDLCRYNDINNICVGTNATASPIVITASASATPSSSRSKSLTPSPTRSPTSGALTCPNPSTEIELEDYQCCPSDSLFFTPCNSQCCNDVNCSTSVSILSTSSVCPINSIFIIANAVCCPEIDFFFFLAYNPGDGFCHYRDYNYECSQQLAIARPVILTTVSPSSTSSRSMTPSRSVSISSSRTPSISATPTPFFPNVCPSGFQLTDSYYQCCPIGYFFDLCNFLCRGAVNQPPISATYPTSNCPVSTTFIPIEKVCCPNIVNYTIERFDSYYGFCKYDNSGQEPVQPCSEFNLILNPVILTFVLSPSISSSLSITNSPSLSISITPSSTPSRSPPPAAFFPTPSPITCPLDFPNLVNNQCCSTPSNCIPITTSCSLTCNIIYSPDEYTIAFYGRWCGPGHGGFQDCCNGGPCPGCNPNTGIITQDCIDECPPIDAVDAACMNHDACVFQFPNPQGAACSHLSNFFGFSPTNFCPCDCYLTTQLVVLQATDYCFQTYSILNPVQLTQCLIFVSCAEEAFTCGAVGCFYITTNQIGQQVPICSNFEFTTPAGDELIYNNCIVGSYNP